MRVFEEIWVVEEDGSEWLYCKRELDPASFSVVPDPAVVRKSGIPMTEYGLSGEG